MENKNIKNIEKEIENTNDTLTIKLPIFVSGVITAILEEECKRVLKEKDSPAKEMLLAVMKIYMEQTEKALQETEPPIKTN